MPILIANTGQPLYVKEPIMELPIAEEVVKSIKMNFQENVRPIWDIWGKWTFRLPRGGSVFFVDKANEELERKYPTPSV